MRTAFTPRRHQIFAEATGVEEVDISGAVQVPVVRRIDKIAVSVCVWANKRLEHRAYGRIEDRCDVMAPAAAHSQYGMVISFLAEVVQRAFGHDLAFARAGMDWAAHQLPHFLLGGAWAAARVVVAVPVITLFDKKFG